MEDGLFTARKEIVNTSMEPVVIVDIENMHNHTNIHTHTHTSKKGIAPIESG